MGAGTSFAVYRLSRKEIPAGFGNGESPDKAERCGQI